MTRLSARVVCVIASLVFVVAEPREARAQAKDRLIMVGLSVIKAEETGVGFQGNVEQTIALKRSCSISAGAGVVFARAGPGLNAWLFGGGVKVTRPMSPRARVFVQGVMGFASVTDDEDSRKTVFGFAPGGGIMYAANETIDVVTEIDLGVLKRHDSLGFGYRLFFGIAKKLGSK